jgi:hypothetical protein
MDASPQKRTYAVFTIIDGPSHSRWVRIGNAVVNGDGSFNIFLDALPANGRLHMREIRDEVSP